MKTARELFEELGFKQIAKVEGEGIGYMKEEPYVGVSFIYGQKVVVVDDELIYKTLDMSLFKAIQKQLQELGWI